MAPEQRVNLSWADFNAARSQVGQMLKLAGVDQLLKACATTFEFDCFRPVDPMFNVVALHDDLGSIDGVLRCGYWLQRSSRTGQGWRERHGLF
jgi:hypothetical protein